jgi:hypothetical protein
MTALRWRSVLVEVKDVARKGRKRGHMDYTNMFYNYLKEIIIDFEMLHAM